MKFQQFICAECGLVGNTESLIELVCDDESKVPLIAKGVAKILVRNKYCSYTCPECLSYVLFYAQPTTRIVSISRNVESSQTSDKQEVAIDKLEVVMPKKRGRKSKKEIIQNLESISDNDNVENADEKLIASELQALIDLAGQVGKEIDIKKAKDGITKIVKNKLPPEPPRPPLKPFKRICDMCKEQFETKFEATRCRNCISRTPSMRR